MTEVCKVVKVKGGYAHIEITRRDACGGCKACNFSKDGTLVIPAIMDVECNAGDTVVVKMPPRQYNAAPFVLFGIPLMMFLIGLIVGKLLESEVFMLIFAFAFFFASMFVAYLIDKSLRSNRNYMPVITDKTLRAEASENPDAKLNE